MSFVDLSQIEEREIVPGFRAKFVHSDKMTFAYWTISAGSILPLHKHHHEQVTNLISGELEFTMKGETKIISPGTAIVIPSNVEHSGKAITDCYVIDVFHPVREDYK